jgi:hypothetical protein
MVLSMDEMYLLASYTLKVLVLNHHERSHFMFN